jgi:ribose/xylose/arabinose/galactoside ABC-type transport system permease subunit
VLYGIAGLLMTSYIRVGMPYLAEGYEFRAITAAALGGISLSGGEGNILKALLGAVILTVLYNLLTILGVSPYLQGIFEGIILIGAVYLCQKK